MKALLPLGAIAAGFGLGLAPAPSAAQSAPPPAPAASGVVAGTGTATQQRLPTVEVTGRSESDRTSFRAPTTTVGRGAQDPRDIPQSTTAVTRKLMEDRRADTVREALHYTAGITFLAAEGGEEDIRLRGFSLTGSGDIYSDNIRDPAFYERDVFNVDRVEVLRGSASMLFGRGSTGGVVNQASKTPMPITAHEAQFTVGTGGYLRTTGDFNFALAPGVAVRLNAMTTVAENWGNRTEKYGIAPTIAWGMGSAHAFSFGLYHLDNDNGVHYGLPYVRSNANGGISATNPGRLLEDVNPRNYYGAASDHAAGSATHGTLRHTWRLPGGGTLNTVVRKGSYDRDQRASTIRFCTRGTGNPVTNPDCPTAAPTADTLGGDTLLTRGTQNKIQDLETLHVQTDIVKRFELFGRRHDLLAGVDLAREEFENFGTTLPAGVVLDKNAPRPSIGAPDDGTSVDEGARVRVLNRTFDAKSVGVYAQDTFEIAPTWKLVAGLRWDKFSGKYRSPAAGTTPETFRSRSDSLWSNRFGTLWQPDDRSSYYASYGTSFNTSGELYNYDSPGAKAPPEKSRNIEIGARHELFSGNLSSRVAVFRSTKYNERNRDSPEGQPLVDFILSGERHASGVELDLAGRITPIWEVYVSYAWIPSARIDEAAFGVAPSGERVGDRPSLTPKHTGSVFTTVQVLPSLRLGAGLTARSSQTPNRNPVGIVVPGFATFDALAEWTVSESVSLKFNIVNIANRHYGDSLYSGHYIPGKARTAFATVVARY
jgi:catecholate siderophore receptor